MAREASIRAGQASRVGPVFVIAAWFGLVAGFAEASLFTVIRYVPRLMTWSLRQVNVSFDFLWTAPLVNLVLFLAIAALCVPFMLIAAIVRKPTAAATAQMAIVVFVWLTCYIVLSLPTRLQTSAILVLSTGVAIQVWRTVRGDVSLWVGWLRRSLVWLVVLVAAVAAFVRGTTVMLEARKTRALPPAAEGAPNVLLIVMDTVRADHMASYGYARVTTPFLDGLAREGVIFERTIATSSWTLPSHASLFTGRFVNEHRADSTQPMLPDRFTTLAEVMSARGYATAGFSANLEWVTRGSGLAHGFVHFDDYLWSPGDAVARTVLGRKAVAPLAERFGYGDQIGRKHGSDVSAAFIDWLDANPDRRFFAFLNYFDAHAPYASPSEYHTKFMTPDERSLERQLAPDLTPPLGAEKSLLTPSFWTAAYDGGLASLDASLAGLFGELRRRGQLDRTLVIVTSDHGEAFADHEFYLHGHSLYLDQSWVPLMFRLPGTVPAGLRVPTPVSLVDVAATVLTISGGAGGKPIPGDSLSRFWSQPAAIVDYSTPLLSEVDHRGGGPARWPISYGWLRSLVTDKWHYIQHENGKIELYNALDDPREVSNLAEKAELGAVVTAFKTGLRETLSRPRDLRASERTKH
jgi:arylsulfatase A-like enzyme